MIRNTQGRSLPTKLNPGKFNTRFPKVKNLAGPTLAPGHFAVGAKAAAKHIRDVQGSSLGRPLSTKRLNQSIPKIKKLSQPYASGIVGT